MLKIVLDALYLHIYPIHSPPLSTGSVLLEGGLYGLHSWAPWPRGLDGALPMGLEALAMGRKAEDAGPGYLSTPLHPPGWLLPVQEGTALLLGSPLYKLFSSG